MGQTRRPEYLATQSGRAVGDRQAAARVVDIAGVPAQLTDGHMPAPVMQLLLRQVNGRQTHLAELINRRLVYEVDSPTCCTTSRR